MGYHVFLSRAGKVVHHYVDIIEKLADLTIDGNTLIYEGEESWKPVLVCESPKYKKFLNRNREVGILAESFFVRDAIDRGYIIEPINQDIDSFIPYKNAGVPLKRGDFLIRNASNLEIEIKCNKIYMAKGGEQCFYFLKKDFEKHLNMAEITGQPIVVVIYVRDMEEEDYAEDEGDYLPVTDTVYSFEIGKLPVKDLKSSRRNGALSYIIPIDYMEEGFSIIDRYLKK